jgi:hypothetical protein
LRTHNCIKMSGQCFLQARVSPESLL